MSIEKILLVLDRAHHGPICTVKDWETRMLPRAVMDKLKKYKLEKTCNPSEPINCNDSLADAFFKAGFELACELGMLCNETERRVVFSEEELHEAIRHAPAELELGEGVDKVVNV